VKAGDEGKNILIEAMKCNQRKAACSIDFPAPFRYTSEKFF
jgi:hypothetical protein